MQTVRFNRDQYRSEWLIQHRGYERSQYRNFKRALDTQTKTCAEYVRNGGIDTLRTHVGLLVNELPVKAAYRACYTGIGLKHAEWQYRKLKAMTKSNGVSFFSAVWKRLMGNFFAEYSGERITSVTETTRDRVIEALVKANELNLSKSETATLLERELSSPEFNRNRALMIARTETTTAANQGAMLAAQSSEYETGKVWICVKDRNTRPDHRDNDGQPAIGMDDRFIVGDSEMLYPGDPAGSAREVIQCRCCLGIAPLLGINGLPVMKIR